jgi:dTDP-4-amino-4,6-dideoxygalactose transaminase
MWKVPFYKPYLLPDGIDSVTKCLQEQRLSQGKYIEAFEKGFVEHVSTRQRALSKSFNSFTLSNTLRIHSEEITVGILTVGE